MTHTIVFIALALAASSNSGTESLCQELKRLGQPQPIFMSHDTPPKLRFDSTPHKPVAMPNRAPSGNYYFKTESDGASTIRVSVGDREDWLISWPDQPGRPIRGAWINAKLLYLEVSVTPRVSVYWIIDVETHSVMLTEIQHDGRQAWNQCFPEKPTPQ